MKVDRVCWDGMGNKAGARRCILAFSASGNSTEIRAVRAALQANRKIEFRFVEFSKGAWPTKVTLFNDSEGYTTTAKSIGMRQYHLVVVARRPGFLPAATPDALWNYLRKETTTPMDRRWLEALSARLAKDGRLTRPSTSGQMDPALVDVDDEYMDKTVKDLLRSGKIRIEV